MASSGMYSARQRHRHAAGVATAPVDHSKKLSDQDERLRRVIEMANPHDPLQQQIVILTEIILEIKGQTAQNFAAHDDTIVAGNSTRFSGMRQMHPDASTRRSTTSQFLDPRNSLAPRAHSNSISGVASEDDLVQDMFFTMAMRTKLKEQQQKEKEAQQAQIVKRLMFSQSHSDKPTRKDRLLRWIFLPRHENRILMGTIRILSNGNQAKLILEIITVVLVFLSVVIIILQSYPQFSEIEDYPSLFYLQTSVIIYFTVEYIVRWDAVRPHISIPRPYSLHEYFWAKLSYTVSFMAIIDLMSIIPYYLELILESQGKGDALPSSALMAFRVVRVLRIFKLTRNNQTLVDFVNAMGVITADLAIFMCVLATCVILVSTAIFYAEQNGPHADFFPDIPSSMWWTVITFTSVGYGDIYPATDAGKVVGAFAALLGVLLMNVPIAFVLISFDEVYSQRKARESRMRRIVEHVFAWSDRHKRNNPLTQINAQKRHTGAAKRQSTYRLYSKRELYRFKKNRKKGKSRLLSVLMNPVQTSKLTTSDVIDDPGALSASNAIMATRNRYGGIWRRHVTAKKPFKSSAMAPRYSWVKRVHRNKVRPANTPAHVVKVQSAVVPTDPTSPKHGETSI